MSRCVGVGVIGYGWVARDHMVPAVAASPAAELVAVHDVRPVGHPAYVADLDAFLATPGLDAVYVATPNAAHRDPVEAVAGAGKAVLVEKPLAADLADAEAMVKACEAAGVVAGVAFDQRWHPAHRRAAELVAAGEVGTVTAVRIVYACWTGPDWSPDGRPHDNWRADPARAGGGAVLDLAPHGLDLVGTLLGGDDVTSLRALVQHRVHDYPVEDGGVLIGRTAGGVLVSLHVAYNTPEHLPRRRLEVVGTRNSLTAVDTLGQTPGGRLLLGDTEVPFDGATSPFRAQLDAFLPAVDGTAPWPYPMARDLRLHALLLHALDSAGTDTDTADTDTGADTADREAPCP